MPKKFINVLVFTLIVVVIWIGYTVYSNVITLNYSSETDLGIYNKSVNTNMYTDTLNKVNAQGNNIKISDSSLAGQ